MPSLREAALPDSLQPGAANVKTHCKRGHSLDDAYLVKHRTRPGEPKRIMRICRTCQLARAAWQRIQKRQRQEALIYDDVN